MQAEYYIVVNDRQEGPFLKEDLRNKNITRETLVWRAGMPEWAKASEIPELEELFIIDVNAGEASSSDFSDNGWYAMIGGMQRGPASIEELISQGLSMQTPVWRPGLHEWVAASSQPEIVNRFSHHTPPHFNNYSQQSYGQQPPYGQPRDFSNNPQYGTNQGYQGNTRYSQQNDYSHNPQYAQGNPYVRNNQRYGNGSSYPDNHLHTNWLPWAIIATIVGFIFSCIGAIFGIIGIVQANKANGLFAAGYDEMAESANNSAKLMSIIGLILAGIGLITTAAFWTRTGGLLDYIV